MLEFNSCTSTSVLEYKKISAVVILMRSALFPICSMLCHVKKETFVCKITTWFANKAIITANRISEKNLLRLNFSANN